MKQVFPGWISFENSLCTPQKSIFLLEILPAEFQQIVISKDNVTAVILVLQNNEMKAMLVYQGSHVGDEHFSYENAFFCPNELA